MSEPTTPPHSDPAPPGSVAAAPTDGPEVVDATDETTTSAYGLKHFRITALIVILLAAALIVWLIVRDDSGSSSNASAPAAAATAAQIKTLPTSLGHPVFWLGPKP